MTLDEILGLRGICPQFRVSGNQYYCGTFKSVSQGSPCHRYNDLKEELKDWTWTHHTNCERYGKA